ncbi:MAG: efflux RND transporter periplasmic adaptor subunit [Elusimicrobiota bacterium]|nr:efflux RND transporter periplasmic adaptor subunit [Elusimicrobiota bacterium]
MKKKIIVITSILVLLGIFVLLNKKLSSKPQFKEIEVVKGDIISTFRISGTIEPRNRLAIRPQIAGRIEDILVSEGEKVKKGQIIAWLSSQERAALLDIAKSQGEQEYKKWQEIYKPTPIIAPLDGFIIVRDKEPGQTVTTADHIVVMADELIIKAYVDETDLRYVKLNQLVNCSLDAYPDVSFLGKVEHIAYESTLINNVTVYELKIKPILATHKPGVPKEFHFIRQRKNKKETLQQKEKSKPQISISSILRSGMTATIEIIAEEKKDVLTLPTSAIQDTGKEKYVLIKKEKQVIKQQIETGMSNGKNTEITSGLTEGDIVLIPQTSFKSSSNTTRTRRPNPMSAFFRR